ncbi:hypothetical protein POM88_051914 [Heracleum sosnowskyi]|uniref:Uncharacterized protein n=1 Tax=Heracleum sosnowskyi TaxID=360622 RepID=A0AAD8GSQ8_9APIA|nr:hypothetical protein POM88_051914 [Heracleum sosnowskyi]
MDHYANQGCVLKVNASCEACRRKVLDVLSSFCDTRSISMDAHTGLAHIRQRVDINYVLHTLAKSGQYAELVRIRVPHVPNRGHFSFANPFLPLRHASLLFIDLGFMDQFGHLLEAMKTANQMFILVTTANNPDVLFPAYKTSRFAGEYLAVKAHSTRAANTGVIEPAIIPWHVYDVVVWPSTTFPIGALVSRMSCIVASFSASAADPTKRDFVGGGSGSIVWPVVARIAALSSFSVVQSMLHMVLILRNKYVLVYGGMGDGVMVSSIRHGFFPLPFVDDRSSSIFRASFENYKARDVIDLNQQSTQPFDIHLDSFSWDSGATSPASGSLAVSTTFSAAASFFGTTAFSSVVTSEVVSLPHNTELVLKLNVDLTSEACRRKVLNVLSSIINLAKSGYQAEVVDNLAKSGYQAEVVDTPTKVKLPASSPTPMYDPRCIHEKELHDPDSLLFPPANYPPWNSRYVISVNIVHNFTLCG